MKPSAFLSFLITFSIGAASVTFAQNEVIREQDSLKGLLEFGVSVNVEQPGEYEKGALGIEAGPIQEQILEKVSQLPVTILDDETLRQSDQLPLLHMHINIMYAEPGYYPYSVELKFYQPVKLSLQDNVGTTAATWHSSFVGAVTQDMADFIGDSALNLVDGFIHDYRVAN